MEKITRKPLLSVVSCNGMCTVDEVGGGAPAADASGANRKLTAASKAALTRLVRTSREVRISTLLGKQVCVPIETCQHKNCHVETSIFNSLPGFAKLCHCIWHK